MLNDSLENVSQSLVSKVEMQRVVPFSNLITIFLRNSMNVQSALCSPPFKFIDFRMVDILVNLCTDFRCFGSCSCVKD